MAASILSGCNLGMEKSGVEIISYPTAKVYIADKEAGMTPYKNNSLKPGELKIKLVANGQEWAKTIHLENGANTVVNREFGDNEESGGYTLYFESTGDKDKSGIMISTIPDRSTVLIDDEIKGFSPIRLDNAGDGDKKLTISFPGKKSINSFVRLVNGYQLVVESDLISEKAIPTPTEANTEVTPTVQQQRTVTIKTTETGWLRVRREASSSSAEVTKVNPGEKYVFLEESGEWTKIQLKNGGEGWVLTKYVDKS